MSMTERLLTDMRSYKYEYLLLASVFIIFFVFVNSLNFNADSLFPFRYANSLLNSDSVRIFVQPGPRFFPDVFYAVIAFIFTDNPANHYYISILINAIVLIIATYYFFKLTLTKKSVALYLATLFLLLLPTSFIILKSRVPFIILIPGMHAYTAALSIFCIVFVLKIFNHEKPNLILYILFSLLVFLLSINNQLFIPMLSVPLLGSLVVLKMIGRRTFHIKPFVPAIVILILGIFISLNAIKFWEMFPSLHIRTNNSHYFKSTITTWFQETGAGFFELIFNFQIVGFFLIVFIVSIATSFLIILRRLIPFNQRRSDVDFVSLFLNVFNLLIFLTLIGALWAINRGTFRYMPHVYIFSTLILFFNIVNYKKLNLSKLKPLTLRGLIFLLLIINIINFFVNPSHDNFKHKSQYDFLLKRLQTLKSEHLISDTGLSSYWVANSGTDQYGFKILPLMQNATPNIHAINLMDFWGESKQSRNYTFIVNRYLAFDNRWSIKKQAVIKTFGYPSQTIKLTKTKNNKFEIYLYPNLNSNPIYNHLDFLIEKYFQGSFEIVSN